jgi:hypothetical protein
MSINEGNLNSADDPTHVIIDDSSLLPGIDHVSEKLHSGEIFSINRADTFALNDEIGFVFECDADIDVHLQFSLDSSDDVSSYLYEAPTYTGGTAVPTIYNRNRNSTNTPEAVVKYLVTVTDNGTELEGFLGGSSGGNKTAATGVRKAWVLKRGTNYLLTFKSLAPGNKINTSILFYEEDFS